jgi:hypothetical protein
MLVLRLLRTIEALSVVEDMIVNNFEVEEDELTAPFGKE